MIDYIPRYVPWSFNPEQKYADLVYAPREPKLLQEPTTTDDDCMSTVVYSEVIRRK